MCETWPNQSSQQKRDGIIQDWSVEDPLVGCLGLLWIAWEARKISETFIRAETAWTAKDRDGRMWRKNDFEERAIKGKITVKVKPWIQGTEAPPWAPESRLPCRAQGMGPLSQEHVGGMWGRAHVLEGWAASHQHRKQIIIKPRRTILKL